MPQTEAMLIMAEGHDVVGFVRQLIPLLLGKENFPTPPGLNGLTAFPPCFGRRMVLVHSRVELLQF